MTKEIPFVSIVIPTRNRRKLVSECLQCIFHQSETDYEVIVSDNGTRETCEREFYPYSQDSRFVYRRPDTSLNMCDHWDFAVEGVKGEYVIFLSEKFMLRYDALEIIKKIVTQYQPEVISWQYDFFELSEKDPNTDLLGEYHPLTKPDSPLEYSPQTELQRRFSFERPLFARMDRNKEGYGKIYGGCVRRQILQNIKKNTGRIFHRYNPDFTSLALILNECKKGVDVRQSLMNVVMGKTLSNGYATRHSLAALKEYVTTYTGSIEEYASDVYIKNFWLGHSVSVATDYALAKRLAPGGPIKNISINRANLFRWLYKDMAYIKNWNGYDEATFVQILEEEISQLSTSLKTEISAAIDRKFIDSPCENEIYHCGLEKLDEFIPNISPIQLADLHWRRHNALPRKNVSGDLMSIADATNYLTVYNTESNHILKNTF